MPAAIAIRSVAWLTRTFPKLPGWWRLVRWLEQQSNALGHLPPQTVRFGGGLRIRVRPEDENGRRVFIRAFEPTERLTRHFIRIVRPGDAVLDIGANMGYYTFVAALLVGPRGVVHAFEAAPTTLRLLQSNIALNPRIPARVHGQAVTDHCGEIEFYSAPPGCTGYSSIRDLGEQSAGVTRVPCITIDSILAELPPVRLVKLDIEGAELLALRGMTAMIERDEPFIISEVDDQFLRQLGQTADELHGFLTKRGYLLYRIGAGGALRPLPTAPRDRCNILACPPGTESLALAQPLVEY